MQKKNFWKEAGRFLAVAAALLVLSYAIVPQVLSNQVVDQGDIRGYRGMVRETSLWNAAHPDDKAAWTDSMFGGMPTIMLSGNPEGDYTAPLFRLLQLGRRPATYFFIALLGSLLLLLAFGVRLLPAAAGAVAMALCSYNMQIIQVGHNTKMLAIAFLPWALAACVHTYRCALKDLKAGSGQPEWRQWLPQTLFGAVLFAFAVSFQIKANHVQISYYLALMLLVYALTLFCWILARKERRRKMGRFWAASLLLLCIGIAGIGTNANQLLPSYRYAQETMRGGSDLTGNEEDGGERKGLALDYATAWSYGWNELPNLLIPDFNGGASAGALPPDSETVSLLRQAGQPNLAQVSENLPLYWGPQPFTAGPMYIGSISIFLFLLGLLLYRGKEKWWLLVTVLLAVLLAVGSHFLPFTEFWFKYVPFYNKFRTVSMALVLLQYAVPLLGFVMLDRLLKGDYPRKEFARKGWAAFGLTAGFCLLCVIFPSLAGDFTGSGDAGLPEPLVRALQQDRAMLLRRDALTSALFIGFAFLLLWSRYWPDWSGRQGRSHGGKTAVALGMLALVLLNMLSVGKRYLNGSHFVPKRQFDRPLQATAADRQILEDKEPSYRVLDLTANVFNESRTSFFHKSVGGYSPVKMQRYQDLIDRHLVGEMKTLVRSLRDGDFFAHEPKTPVLNMLNAKYYLVGSDVPPVRNPWACGSCWLVDRALEAGTPMEEITLLGRADLKSEAVIGNDFSAFRTRIDSLSGAALTESPAGAADISGAADVTGTVHSGTTGAAGAASASPTGVSASAPAIDVSAPASAKGIPAGAADRIVLSSYTPNKLKYNYAIRRERAAVFSEIYYPEGWTARLEDGTEIPIFRADWTLRGAILPAGRHELTLRFDPPSYRTGRRLSQASSLLLYLLLLLSGLLPFRLRKSL